MSIGDDDAKNPSHDTSDHHLERRLQLVAQSKDLAEQKSRTPTQFGSNHFKSAQWSADGTCIITNSSDNIIRTYVVPPDLLDERSQPLLIEEYSVVRCAEPADAVALYPFFDLQMPSTTLMLSAINEHPLRLHSALTGDLIASYPLVNQTTEAYIKPKSLIFMDDGSSFVAGSDSQISIFDVSRPGEEPVTTFKTGPKSKNSTWADLSVSMRGLISALAIDKQYNVLAAGTLSRHIGLYDAGGRGGCVGIFSVQDTEADQAIRGNGITQTLWSSCGRYLFIAERKSHGVMYYDIRKSGQLLGWLEQRNSDTNQRLCVDVWTNQVNSTNEVWAGGTDGVARMWLNPQSSQGRQYPAEFFIAHKDSLCGLSMHPSGAVLATASGQRHLDDISGESELKLWSSIALDTS